MLHFLTGNGACYSADGMDVTGWFVGAVVAIVTALYYYYYTSSFGKLPAVYCKQGTKLRAILDGTVPTLRKRYKPPIWCAESRCQTIVRYFYPCPSKITWDRQVVNANEGGKFYIDWFENTKSTRFPKSETRPTVLIIPGMTSTTKSNYVKSMANCLAGSGFRVMVLIYRGLEGMELLTPMTCCATYTGDLEQTINIFLQCYPKADLYTIGASLGSVILGQYLSAGGKDVDVKAGMLFACPFNPPECMNELETWSNKWLMNIHVAQNLKRQYRRHRHLFESVVDNNGVESAKLLRDFDHHFTAPVFGYKSTTEYYEKATLDEERLKNIKIPLLCVGASDDPFSPERALPKEQISQTENVALVMTHGGGHVSHLQEWFPYSKSYFEMIMVEYFDALTS